MIGKIILLVYLIIVFVFFITIDSDSVFNDLISSLLWPLGIVSVIFITFMEWIMDIVWRRK